MAQEVYVVIEFDRETDEFSEVEGVFQSKEKAEDFAKECSARYLRYSYGCYEGTYDADEVDAVLAEKDKEIAELKCKVNGLQSRSKLWHYNAVEEHKNFVQADKVIAEKDKVIADLEQKLAAAQQVLRLNEPKALYSNLETMRRLTHEKYVIERRERHHKYKRCLAMAQEWRNYAAFCGMQSSCHNHRGFGKTAEKWTWKECHAWKCVKRLLELAEKFKEAK